MHQLSSGDMWEIFGIKKIRSVKEPTRNPEMCCFCYN